MPEKVVAFGEIMLRLSPPGQQRIVQTHTYDVTYGGAEANALASLAAFGARTELVTRLPQNELSASCVRFLHQHGVGTDHVVYGGDRLGVYFYEGGAALRGGQVIYDRTGSALATIQPGMVDWDTAFEGVDWFHWTGITPAVSESAAAVTLEALKAADRAGVTVSVDLNYRAKLWQWGKAPNDVMPELVALCDMVIGDKRTVQTFFGIDIGQDDSLETHKTVCDALAEHFSRVKTIAMTLRRSLSASHNRWGALLWRAGDLTTAPEYEITPIVDRVGGGDSFTGALIYALDAYPTLEEALHFAVAASALKLTIEGDFNQVTQAEVEALMQGHAGSVRR